MIQMRGVVVLSGLGPKVIYALGHIPVLGRILRRMARCYQEGSAVTIRQGWAAGMRWRRYSRYVSGYGLGIYEPRVQAAIAERLAPGATFYDVGANAGFFSLLAGNIVGENGAVFAFEPDPLNASTIEEQFDLNGLYHCHVIQEAVADGTGQAVFVRGGDSSRGRLALAGGAGGTSVSTVTIDEFASSHRSPDLIKVDVEGGEADVLKGARGLMRSSSPPQWIIELHGEERAAEVRGLLQGAGYSVSSLDGGALSGPVLPRHVVAESAAKKGV